MLHQVLPAKDFSPQVISNPIEVLLIKHCFTYGSVEGRVLQIFYYVVAKVFVFVHWIWASPLPPTLPPQVPRSHPPDLHKTECILWLLISEELQV